MEWNDHTGHLKPIWVLALAESAILAASIGPLLAVIVSPWLGVPVAVAMLAGWVWFFFAAFN